MGTINSATCVLLAGRRYEDSRGLSLDSMVEMVLNVKYGLITRCQARED